MPLWLITFLTGLVEPIVEKIISKLFLESRLKKLEEKQEKVVEGFSKLNSAKTDEEFDSALSDIASSWNK